MIEHNVTAALADGYDVILEGILSRRSYGEVIERILASGLSMNYLYSFDVSLDGTLRRHRSRAIQDRDFTEDDMREWYPHAHVWEHDLERLIPESARLEATVARILAETGLDAQSWLIHSSTVRTSP